jgi:hypothetical protein
MRLKQPQHVAETVTIMIAALPLRQRGKTAKLVPAFLLLHSVPFPSYHLLHTIAFEDEIFATQ